MSEASPLPGRQSARERALSFRESERLNRQLMDEAGLPHVREKYRTAAERFARLAEADERLAASPIRAPLP